MKKVIHDHECCLCGHSFEALVEWDEYVIICEKCGSEAKRVYKSFNGIENNSPAWLKDVIEVVDKDSGEAHCDDFVKNPTKANYKAWMKGSGLRPMEQGESMKLKKRDTSKIRKRVMENFKSRNTVEVRSQP